MEEKRYYHELIGTKWYLRRTPEEMLGGPFVVTSSSYLPDKQKRALLPDDYDSPLLLDNVPFSAEVWAIAQTLADIHNHQWAGVRLDVSSPYLTAAEVQRETHKQTTPGAVGFGVTSPEVVIGQHGAALYHRTGSGRLSWTIDQDQEIHIRIYRPHEEEENGVVVLYARGYRHHPVSIERNNDVPIYIRHVNTLIEVLDLLNMRYFVEELGDVEYDAAGDPPPYIFYTLEPVIALEPVGNQRVPVKGAYEPKWKTEDGTIYSEHDGKGQTLQEVWESVGSPEEFLVDEKVVYPYRLWRI